MKSEGGEPYEVLAQNTSASYGSLALDSQQRGTLVVADQVRGKRLTEFGVGDFQNEGGLTICLEARS